MSTLDSANVWLEQMWSNEQALEAVGVAFTMRYIRNP